MLFVCQRTTINNRKQYEVDDCHSTPLNILRQSETTTPMLVQFAADNIVRSIALQRALPHVRVDTMMICRNKESRALLRAIDEDMHRSLDSKTWSDSVILFFLFD